MPYAELKCQPFKVTVTTTACAVRFKTTDYYVHQVQVVPGSGKCYVNLGNETKASAGTTYTLAAALGPIPSGPNGVTFSADPARAEIINLKNMWLNGTTKSFCRVYPMGMKPIQTA